MSQCFGSPSPSPVVKGGADYVRVRFFGRIQDWIYDLRSHRLFVPTKETKNPKTASLPHQCNLYQIKVLRNIYDFLYISGTSKEKIALKTHLDCSPRFTQIAGKCTFIRLPLVKRSSFGSVYQRNAWIMNPKNPDSDMI